MPTVQKVLDLLVAADDELTAEYSSAPSSLRPTLDFCSLTIESIIKEVVRSDLHSRTGQIKQLTEELNQATGNLKDLKSTIENLTQIGQIGQKLLNALAALLPLL